MIMLNHSKQAEKTKYENLINEHDLVKELKIWMLSVGLKKRNFWNHNFLDNTNVSHLYNFNVSLKSSLGPEIFTPVVAFSQPSLHPTVS